MVFERFFEEDVNKSFTPMCWPAIFLYFIFFFRMDTIKTKMVLIQAKIGLKKQVCNQNNVLPSCLQKLNTFS